MSMGSGVKSQQRNGETEKRGNEENQSPIPPFTHLPSRLAFVFPGQGSQCVGMAKEFHDRYTQVRDVFKEAGNILGFDMARLCFEGPEVELNLTHNTQPAILTASIAFHAVLNQEAPLRPDLVAGHSLGEYTALVVSGAMDFKDALRLVAKRGRFMQDAVPQGTGAMAAVLGLSGGRVEEVCQEASTQGNVVVPANFNSPEQTVISGHKEAVERASSLAREKGAKRVVPLPVSVPSHSPLMRPAAERLSKELENIQIKPLHIPVVTNVEAEPLSSSEKVKELLERQLYSPVQWVASIQRMKREGVETIVEVGPGRVLAGLIKRIDSSIKTLNIEKPDDLKQLTVHG